MEEQIRKLLKENGHTVTKDIEVCLQELLEAIKVEAENKSDISGVLEWLEKKRREPQPQVAEIPVNKIPKWKTDPETGNIYHESGKFFSVIGISVANAEDREVSSWSQPIIKQHECGILGILRQNKNEIMHYLMWAKFEPGSIVNPQLSPTLQATFSNLARAHGGKKPLFAEYFETPKPGSVIVSVVHVEDPSRFYLKTNRCMVVEIPENEKIDVPEDYIWLTLPQIKKLLKIDNVINALAKNVLSSL